MDDELVFKLRQEYQPWIMPFKAVNILVYLALVKDEIGEGRDMYPNDVWNENDYSHERWGSCVRR
jgi:hypothetical protein